MTIVYGGYPISDPYARTVGGKVMPYNLIDTDPSCFHQGICNMFPPGGRLSSFPNSEEKFQHILHNLHRMFSNQSLSTPLGKWNYGANTNGGRSTFCRNCKYCGTTHRDRRPLMWYSDANQMARFKQWDEHHCDQKWYESAEAPHPKAHSTCKWGNTTIPSWRGFTNGVLSVTYRGSTYLTGTNRCALFGWNPSNTSDPNNPTPFATDCTFAARAGKFCHDDKDNCWFETEGICGGNTCLWDSHCEPIFANKYDYVGKGFVADMNGVGAIYSRFTKEIYYPLPIGTHYDQRWRIVEEDRETVSGKYFTLLLEYFDFNRTQTPANCYAIYDGRYHNMNVYVSNHPYDGGDYKAGVYDNDDFSVFFKSNHLPPATPGCQPYSFLCKTSLGNFFRLPEDTDYYFGTEWIDWKWSDLEGDFGYTCKENHYYRHSTEGWTVNGGPTLTKSDIWYYQDTVNYGSCIGCTYIANLECWENCIRSDFTGSQCQCSGSHSPTTGAPTNAPTSPTSVPTTTPTNIPTSSTNAPTTIPTLPTNLPTTIPSKIPTGPPTNIPTLPTKMPTKIPTNIPTKTSTNIPTNIPTKIPTNMPTKTPTNMPVKTPTNTPTVPTTKAPTTKRPTPKDGDTYNPTKQPTEPTPMPTRSPLTLGKTHSPSMTPTISPTITEIEGQKGNEEDSTTNNVGGIAAGVILGLICIICIMAYIYWRIETGKPIYPTKSELRLPNTASTNQSQNESQISRQITEDNMRMQIQHTNQQSGEYDANYINYGDGANGENGQIAKGGDVPVKPPAPPSDAIKGGGDGNNDNMTYIDNEYEKEPLDADNSDDESDGIDI